MTGSGSAISERGIAQLILIGAGAFLLGWVFWTGYRIGLQADRTNLIAAIWTHVGHGIVVTPLLVGYLWCRTAASTKQKHRAISQTVFWMLIIAVVFLILSGPVVVWTYGSDLKVFDWFVIPNPIEKLPLIHNLLEAAHKYIALVLPGLVALDFLLIFARRRRGGATNS